MTRFSGGLGAMTHLTDTFPWGIWVSFDVLCGVALAAGGFLIAGSVYIFRMDRFRPILRPSMLTAYLGYLLVIGGLLVDLGRPYNIWHPIIYRQHRSVMFEVGWYVTLYTIALTIEFLPILLEKLAWISLLRVVRSLTIPVVIAGIILSTLHQSSLGALLIVPKKLIALWYSPFLPLFFFTSAVAGDLAMVIIETSLSARAFGKSLEVPIIHSLANAMAIVLVVYLLMIVLDISRGEAWVEISRHPAQGISFAVEMSLMTLPILLVLGARQDAHPRRAIFGAVSTVLGIILNRLNVASIGMIPYAGVVYIPSVAEIVITVNLISYGVVVFALAAKYLPLFEHTRVGEARVERETTSYVNAQG